MALWVPSIGDNAWELPTKAGEKAVGVGCSTGIALGASPCMLDIAVKCRAGDPVVAYWDSINKPGSWLTAVSCKSSSIPLHADPGFA